MEGDRVTFNKKMDGRIIKEAGDMVIVRDTLGVNHYVNKEDIKTFEPEFDKCEDWFAKSFRESFK